MNKLGLRKLNMRINGRRRQSCEKNWGLLITHNTNIPTCTSHPPSSLVYGSLAISGARGVRRNSQPSQQYAVVLSECKKEAGTQRLLGERQRKFREDWEQGEVWGTGEIREERGLRQARSGRMDLANNFYTL